MTAADIMKEIDQVIVESKTSRKECFGQHSFDKTECYRCNDSFNCRALVLENMEAAEGDLAEQEVVEQNVAQAIAEEPAIVDVDIEVVAEPAIEFGDAPSQAVAEVEQTIEQTIGQGALPAEFHHEAIPGLIKGYRGENTPERMTALFTAIIDEKPVTDKGLRELCCRVAGEKVAARFVKGVKEKLVGAGLCTLEEGAMRWWQ